MSLVAVGDIHGNIRALDDLLDRITRELSVGDTLVFLGDYIDRGPHVRECVDRIIELKEATAFSVITLGNHEDWMLKSYRDHSAHSWIVGMESFETIASYSTRAVEVLRGVIERDGMSMILGKSELPYEVFFNAVPPMHLWFFENLQRYHQAEGVLCVHGGIDLDVTELEAQHPDAFLWGCETFPDSYAGKEHIVYGHHNNAVLSGTGWPHPNIKTNRTYGIDTIAHGVLTAIRFPGGDVFQSKRFTV
jgi:serine/threonine protein phosphatase 1